MAMQSSCLLKAFVASYSFYLLNTCSESWVMISWSKIFLTISIMACSCYFASWAASHLPKSSLSYKIALRLSLKLSKDPTSSSRDSTCVLIFYDMWSSFSPSLVCGCSAKGSNWRLSLVTPSIFCGTFRLSSLPILSLLIRSFRARFLWAWVPPSCFRAE